MEDWNGKCILPQAPDMVIETDASLLGWGASMGSTVPESSVLRLL